MSSHFGTMKDVLPKIAMSMAEKIVVNIDDETSKRLKTTAETVAGHIVAVPAVIPKPLAFAAVGPLIDGHVEIPIGSGNRFAADGILGDHPDWPRIRDVSASLGYDLRIDATLVIDHFAPLGMLYYCGHVAFVNRRGMKIKSVFVAPQYSAQRIVEDLIGRHPVSGPVGWNERPTIEVSRDAETPTDFHLVCTKPGYNVVAQLGDRPCYRCDARTEVNGDVPLCARCRAET